MVRHSRWFGIGCLVVLLLAGTAVAQPAGNYKSVAVSDKFNTRAYLTETKTRAKQVLSGVVTLDQAQEALRSWYVEHELPLFTQPSELGMLAERRQSLLDDLTKCSDPAVHRYLVDTMFPILTAIVKDNYHPAVRINAMLLIGQMNSQEYTPVNRSLPVPYGPALEVLLTEYKSDTQLDGVKVAALIGILRHVSLERQQPQVQPIAGNQKADILRLMRDLALQSDPPANRGLEGHTWLRRRAIDVLAQAAKVKDDPALVDEMTKIIENAEAPESLRITAALALGDLDYAEAKGDPLAKAQALARLAVQSVQREEARLKEEQKTATAKKPASSFGGGGSGYPGLGGGDTGLGDFGQGGGDGNPYTQGRSAPSEKEETEADIRIRRSRRILKHKLEAALYGMRGPEIRQRLGGGNPQGPAGGVVLLGTDDDAKKQQVAELIAALQETLNATDPQDPEQPFSSTDQLIEAVLAKVAKLEELLPKPEVPIPAGQDLPGAVLPGDVPGAEVPGAEVPGGNVPAGNVPGGAPQGGDVPGGAPQGGAPQGGAPQGGGDVPGGEVPGGDVPGGNG